MWDSNRVNRSARRKNSGAVADSGTGARKSRAKVRCGRNSRGASSRANGNKACSRSYTRRNNAGGACSGANTSTPALRQASSRSSVTVKHSADVRTDAAASQISATCAAAIEPRNFNVR
ncbi:hypothetical protein D3C72_1974240 [compost metagenome]